MMPERTMMIIVSPLTLVFDGTLSNNADNVQLSVLIAFSA